LVIDIPTFPSCSASSEKKLSRRGKLPPQPEPELGLPIFARAKFGSRDSAGGSLRQLWKRFQFLLTG
jgi:hypothetical protein